MSHSFSELAQQLFAIRREFHSAGSSSLPRYLAASDLHGNATRVGQIIDVAEREGIDKIFLVGDLYSGPSGWSLYRLLLPLAEDADGSAGKVVPLWGNHELAFVSGMLGNDRQLRFFYAFGGRELVDEMNAELQAGRRATVSLSGSKSPTDEDLSNIRAHRDLREMASWIQRTHRLFARDRYGTGYMHAFPKINRQRQITLQYQGMIGMDALAPLEADLRAASGSDHPVFSTLLQTDNSPLWALYEIKSAAEFDGAFHPHGIRQIVYGHRHWKNAVNISRLNRQIGIAVDFDQGLGGYLLIGHDGLRFHSFVEEQDDRTVETQLFEPTGGHTPARSFLQDVEEFWYRQLAAAEVKKFQAISINSNQNRREFEALETLRRDGFPWIHRLYAELYVHVKPTWLRKQMFAEAVGSCDEEAFRSFIHLLYEKFRQLASHGNDWYCEEYVKAKADAEVLLSALGEMPLHRLGLLDVKLRGTTSRANLLDIYGNILDLGDPELAILAVRNLGALETPQADQKLRRAFSHDVRKVRLEAADVLAKRGAEVYPLVVSLFSSQDNWVRFLAVWTVSRLGACDVGVREQAIKDIRAALRAEKDWLIYTVGRELLRKLGDANPCDFSDRLEIPNLTDTVIEKLQSIVDCQNEPFRKRLGIYYITAALSSLVYRRGLIGMDIDDLRIFVSNADYFPPHFRHYKSGELDDGGQWQGWRELWIRGETLNQPDGPRIVELSPSVAEDTPPGDGQSIVLYDHRIMGEKVTLPELDDIIATHGLGKVKDRIRHCLLSQWDDFSKQEQALLSRLHAAAVVTMLFDLPAEIYLTKSELGEMEMLAQHQLQYEKEKPWSLITLDKPLDELLLGDGAHRHVVASLQWIDARKYPVHIRIAGHSSENDAIAFL